MNTPTEIKTSDKAYLLYYDNRAYRKMEEQTGKPFARFQHESISEMTSLLWAGLLRHQPKATIETADEIIDDLGYETVMQIVVKAVEQSPPFQKSKE